MKKTIKTRVCVRPSLRLPISCSRFVLASLGVLVCTGEAGAQAAGTQLPPGTLPVLRGVVAGQIAINAPVKGASRPLLTIDQATQRAIIDWKSFNIASDSEVRFNQPSSAASALNRIYSADPTIVQGRLTANGQVLLINQNGILFDRGAQVNVQSLVASTLNISNTTFNQGSLAAGGLAKAAFEGRYDNEGNTLAESAQPGSIVIGGNGLSSAAAPSLTTPGGGSILLIAPHIDNRNGLIAAPDGQVILAAGSKAFLAFPEDDEGVLRGFRVEVQAAAGGDLNLSNVIRNAGAVSADRGNVTLAALAINQNGRVSANTAIQGNGSVYLKAGARGTDQIGTATFGLGSRTEVLPDKNDKATLPESESFVSRRGVIQVDSGTITSLGSINAEGGRVTLTATNLADPSAARIYFGEGSTTSVAGHWADVPFETNLLTFKVTSNELKDSPDQKQGILRGATVTVDLRKPNPALDLSGYINAQGRTVEQKTAAGGELQITTGGSVILRPGATLDASGGGYRYSGGTVATTRLLGSDGRIYDIGTAPKDRPYTQLLDNFQTTETRWNQTTNYSGLLYNVGQQEAGYVEGKPGGKLFISSGAGLVLDGAIRGGVTVGPTQLDKAPRGAALKIGALNQEATDFADSQRIGNLTFRQAATDSLGSGFVPSSLLTQTQRDNFTLSADQVFGAATTPAQNVYLQAAFDSVEVNANGQITVPAGVSLEGAPGSGIFLRSSKLDVAGSIEMPSGRITLQPQATQNSIDGSSDRAVTLRSGARLSTAGVWINKATVDGSYVGDPIPSAREREGVTTSMLNGGQIAVQAANQSVTSLEGGATIDVGGGAAFDRSGRLTNGNGGTLSIFNTVSDQMSSDWLRADLFGFAPGNGARLAITTPRVVIDGAEANGTLPGDTTRLLPGLFANRGFSSIDIRTTDSLIIRSGAAVAVRQLNRVIDPQAAASLVSGGDLRSISRIEQLPDFQRQAASLSLSSTGNSGVGTLTMEQGSSIVVDPRARVTLASDRDLRIEGQIVAPGGTVALLQSTPNNQVAGDLSLGASAHISVSGTFVAQPNAFGLRQGSVIGAGAITIEATNAGVHLATGSQLDLEGISKTIDVADAAASSGVRQVQVNGNAGALVIKSQRSVELGSSLNASRPAADSAGGSFALELNAPSGQSSKPAERRIVVAQSSSGILPNAGDGFVDAQIDIGQLRNAGFDKLRLQSEDRVAFVGDVNVSFARGVRIDAPLVEVDDGSTVKLQAATVAIGQSLAPRVPSAGTYELQVGAASPVRDTRAGTGHLSVEAGTIDVFGSLAINGVAETKLFADGDIRVTGRTVLGSGNGGGTLVASQKGSLVSAGNLSLLAAQVYPSTRTDFTMSVADGSTGAPIAGGTITIAGNGRTAGDVYSAGGKLTLAADSIAQGGVLKAPLGELDLRAQTSLDLLEGSVTSVSGSGLTVPYGTTTAGVTWSYADGLGFRNVLSSISPTGKRIELAGRSVAVRTGAKVELAGGGEVQAIEFVPGNGGSKDTLVQAGTYAIIPRAALTSAPVDTDLAQRQDIGFGLQTASQDTAVYDSLYIGAGGVVPAGEYVLLPGRYALLPGAFLVQVQTGSRFTNLQPGETAQLANGQTVVAGYRVASNSDVRDSNVVGVVVRPGSTALRESDFTLTESDFFAKAAARARVTAPRQPIDAGRLAISNVTSLQLDGQFNAAPAQRGSTQGRSVEVDLSAEQIAVVDHVGRSDIDPAYLQVSASSLSALGGSVLVGGLRSDTAAGMQITTRARSVVVANDASTEFKAREVLLLASESIDIRRGSLITGSGQAGAGGTIAADAAGALVRVSGGSQAAVDRGAAVNASAGDVTIEAGATLRAAGSVLIDGTRTTRSRGTLDVGRGGSLAMASSQVSLGETDGVPGLDRGLVLSNGDLASLVNLNDLTLKGYHGIDLFGEAVVGSASLGTLTLDAASLRGHTTAGTRGASIVAKEVRLVNSTGAISPATTTGGGSLIVNAPTIVLGQGSKSIGGYARVTTRADGEIVALGVGTMAVAADWTLGAPRIAVAGGSNQTWRALDDGAGLMSWKQLALEGGPGPLKTSSLGAGGRLALEGRSVDVSTTVQALSGTISVSAKGNSAGDGITLGASGKLDAHDLSKNYNGNIAIADAGRVVLNAGLGDVTLAQGSVVDVGGRHGGSGGSLHVSASTLTASGVLNGGATGRTAGEVTLDLGTVTDFSRLNRALNEGAFTESRNIRVRGGDLRVAQGDVIEARHISLAADAGRIDIEGTLDARSIKGGATVDVWAASGLALTGARVLADGTNLTQEAAAAASNGGVVRMATAGGALTMDGTSVIDVSPGAKGDSGRVTFSVARDPSNRLSPTSLQGTVLSTSHGNGSAGEVTLEGRRVYIAAGALTAAAIGGFAADHAAFVSGTDAAILLGGLQGTLNSHVRGSTEVRSVGDLSLTQPWNLTTNQWLSKGEPGTLALRAAGNLTISNALGLPDDTARAGDTWNIRLVGGADLSAANPLATQTLESVQSSGRGNVLISGDSGKVRTGTGSIEIAAASDFTMNTARSVVYTSGKIGATDVVPSGNNRWAIAGGDIFVAAGRDAIGNSDQWITDWMRRPRSSSDLAANAEWWVYRPFFQQGLGTLGGGDVTIKAGRNVSGMSAMLPTTGRSALVDGQVGVDVQGGGNLVVEAGNAIDGGAFLVARGTGILRASGDVGSSKRVQLYLQGQSSGAVPEEASIRIDAGGNVAIQSVDNPTTVYMNATSTAAVTGLSFGPFAFWSTFFTYSPNSIVTIGSKAGDVVLGNEKVRSRTILTTDSNPSSRDEISAAYPSSLRAVSFEGDVKFDLAGGSRLVIYPSAEGSVSLLAQGSLFDPALFGADLAVAAIATSKAPTQLRQITSTYFPLSTSDQRLVQREERPGFVYDLQALTGSIEATGANTVEVKLPAVSRVRAGVDVAKVSLTLQNLTVSDVSEVRADAGDLRPDGIEIRGPGRLLAQAGRDIDLGAVSLTSTGNNFNSSLVSNQSARATLIAGVTADVDLAKLDRSYAQIIGINSSSEEILALFRALNGDTKRDRLIAVKSLTELAELDSTYAKYVALGTKYPQLLSVYQATLRVGSLPLGSGGEAATADALYALLNRESNVQAIANANSINDLVVAIDGNSGLSDYVAFDTKYPRVFTDYRQRRIKGALPVGLTPILFSDVLAQVVDSVAPKSALAAGSISSYLTSIQTFGGSDVDLWAPNGSALVGLTTPSSDTTIGVLTNTGGAVRSVVGGDFNINQGKVLTVQGGDILIFSSGGGIDAGRGAKTSISTPPPKRTAIIDPETGAVVGYRYTVPPSASGSGIQTLTSDPDGLGPLSTPPPGNVYLFAPAGTIDAGEAGIRSGGNIVIAAQTVLNASNISSAGASVGVPVAATGSLASSVATSGANTAGTSKAGDEAANASSTAARAAAAAQLAKPTILVVEVLGFGDKNCKEQDKNCFAK